MVAPVPMQARCGSIKANLTILAPEETPENASVCRTEASKPLFEIDARLPYLMQNPG